MLPPTIIMTKALIDQIVELLSLVLQDILFNKTIFYLSAHLMKEQILTSINLYIC